MSTLHFIKWLSFTLQSNRRYVKWLLSRRRSRKNYVPHYSEHFERNHVTKRMNRPFASSNITSKQPKTTVKRVTFFISKYFHFQLARHEYKRWARIYIRVFVIKTSSCLWFQGASVTHVREFLTYPVVYTRTWYIEQPSPRYLYLLDYKFSLLLVLYAFIIIINGRDNFYGEPFLLPTP